MLSASFKYLNYFHDPPKNNNKWNPNHEKRHDHTLTYTTHSCTQIIAELTAAVSTELSTTRNSVRIEH